MNFSDLEIIDVTDFDWNDINRFSHNVLCSSINFTDIPVTL